eukprot:contig_15452_g3693
MARNGRGKRRSRSSAPESGCESSGDSSGKASRPHRGARHVSPVDLDALFDRIVSVQAKKLEEVSTALAAQLASMRAEIKNEVKAQLGTVVAGQITIINEELLANGQRMPSAQQVAVLTSTMEIDAVKDLVPAGGGAFLVPFNQRSMGEVRVAVARALSLSQIRHCHSLAVCLTVLRLGVTAPAEGDGLTCFFSPASKQAGQNSHAIKNFKRVSIAALNKLITVMGASGHAPAVFQGQARVVPSRIGRFEEAALSFI